ncbi:hypothetical protein [Lactococcus sp. DD01]|uniref:hypothetical protein n=1 Tax=Lactococcus sp. DD01 TaxID=1776443 RepID=UPI000776331D|nr:hypothetical protein [Lactococcus sp. DD01]KXT59147.1 Phage-related protein [Lactococcus sp. DD01]
MNYTYFGKMSKVDGRIEIMIEEIPFIKGKSGSVKSAIKNIEESLGQWLLAREEAGEDIPEALEPFNIDLNSGETLVTLNIDTDLVRDREINTMVKKTVTIPKYLNNFGNRVKINFSKLLTDTLNSELSKWPGYLDDKDKVDFWVDLKNISTDETLSEEVLEFTNSAVSSYPIKHLVLKKKDKEDRIYYIFRVLDGKAVMNWEPMDYKLAEKQIYIGEIPIVMELENESGSNYFNIPLEYRKKE